MTNHPAVVIVDTGYASDLGRALDAHLVVDGRAPDRLEVHVREIRSRRAVDGVATPTALEQRDVHLVCRRITSVGSTTFYAPVDGQPVDQSDWAGATRSILRLAVHRT